MVYFCRFCRCLYFICGIIWDVNRFICILLINNQLYVVFLYYLVSSICFFPNGDGIKDIIVCLFPKYRRIPT